MHENGDRPIPRRMVSRQRQSRSSACQHTHLVNDADAVLSTFAAGVFVGTQRKVAVLLGLTCECMRVCKGEGLGAGGSIGDACTSCISGLIGGEGRRKE